MAVNDLVLEILDYVALLSHGTCLAEGRRGRVCVGGGKVGR